MLHFALHWPQKYSEELWPFAINYAVYLWNRFPDAGSHLSPLLEVFTGVKLPDHDELKRARVFGCPCYVLEPTIQDGKKTPKWHRRAGQYIFIGFSPSKFYALKYHWFRSWLKPKEIELQYIDTKEQKANIFTKLLATNDFLHDRKLTCGW